MPSQCWGSATRKLPSGSVAKYSDSKAHKTVLSEPGPSPPKAAASTINGTYVMNGIDVGRWSGSRATCARTAKRMAAPYLRAGDGLVIQCGRRVPMPGMDVSGVLTTSTRWEMGGENLLPGRGLSCRAGVITWEP